MSDQPNSAMYPDVSAAGTLVHAIQDRFDKENIQLTAHWRTAAPGWARVEHGDRSCTVALAVERRLFIVDHWSDGLLVGRLETSELATVVGAVVRWVESKTRLSQMGAEFPDFVATAEGLASDEGNLVAYQWQQILQRDDATARKYAPLLKVASMKPHTRTLTPYLSMGRLCFSRKPTYPFSENCPSVSARSNGRFRVGDGSGNLLGEADADEAAEVLERALATKGEEP